MTPCPCGDPRCAWAEHRRIEAACREHPGQPPGPYGCDACRIATAGVVGAAHHIPPLTYDAAELRTARARIAALEAERHAICDELGVGFIAEDAHAAARKLKALAGVGPLGGGIDEAVAARVAQLEAQIDQPVPVPAGGIWPGWVESHGGMVLWSRDGERLASVHRDSWWRWTAGGRGGSVATMAAAQLAAQDALVGLEGEIRAARGAP